MRVKMTRGLILIAAVGLTSGCAVVGSNPFTDVDLKSNLSAQTLNRYDREWKTLSAAGEGSGMDQLELSNWWPLGLVLYWHKGSVMRTESPQGPVYMVSRSEGYGPLSMLFSAQTHATFDARGARLSGMTVQNYILGHLAMVHRGDAILSNGQKQEMTAMHLFHHLVNVHSMDGHTEVSFLTGPNPVGVESHSHSGAHAAHMHH